MRKLSVVGFVLAVLLAAGIASVSAATYTGTVVITCLGFGGSVGGMITFDRNNSGLGSEITTAVATDGYGNVIFSDLSATPLGTYPYPLFFPYTTAPQANPITFTLTSVAGNSFAEQVIVSIQGSCEGLPTVASAGAADSCPPLTDVAVVGDLPFDTAAYYEPGMPAPGVTLNAGTYWVLGVDESGEYYKIRLSCDYLWVPVGSMQPSFQDPWSGQPLPTEVVS